MNVDAITKQIMEAIDEAASFDDKQARQHAEYAISRAVGSIISGLSPVQTNGAPPPTERTDSAQMFADDATYNTIGDVPCCGHCPILKSSKTRSDRPVASTTESPASAPACGPERVADSGHPIPAHVCHWPNCASAELADEKIASLTRSLRDLWQWTQDVDRGPFVPDELGAQILQVLDEPKLVDKPHDNHVPTDLRRELMKLAQETDLSYYYFCGLYQRGLADGQAGKPVL